MIYDLIQFELIKMQSQENSYCGSPAGSEVVQLISVIRMTRFWHCWRKQEALQTGNVYQITTTSLSVYIHTQDAAQTEYRNCNHVSGVDIFFERRDDDRATVWKADLFQNGFKMLI